MGKVRCREVSDILLELLLDGRERDRVLHRGEGGLALASQPLSAPKALSSTYGVSLHPVSRSPYSPGSHPHREGRSLAHIQWGSLLLLRLDILSLIKSSAEGRKTQNNTKEPQTIQTNPPPPAM